MYQNESVKQTFDDKYMNDVADYLLVLQEKKENYAFREISSHRTVIGGFIVFFKRLIRKCIKWYIEPICNQQTDFNNAMTSLSEKNITVLNELKGQLNSLNQMINEERERANFLQMQLEQYEKYIEVMKEVDIAVKANENVWEMKSFSQAGEDAICTYIFKILGKNFHECTYLDLGANHAKTLSNTYFLYRQGAHGVLVEANPRLIPELKFYRHGDIILNKCIAETSGEKIKFYIMNGDGLSSCSLESAQQAISVNNQLEIIDTVEIETITVNDIMENYFGEAPTILNIDIEGNDLEILQGINFEKHRPLIIITEMIEYQPNLVVGEKNNKILDLLNAKGYTEYAFTGINSIFIDINQIRQC